MGEVVPTFIVKNRPSRRGEGEETIQAEIIRLERPHHFLPKEGTMPVPKNKPPTSTPDPSTSDPSSPVLPDQHVFHQYLRTLAQSAVRIVIETVRRTELDQFIGAAWGESSPKRK